MKRLSLLILALLLPVSVAAQPLEVVSSNPGDGASGVPLETTVSFTFSRPLNPEVMLQIIPAVVSFDLVEVDPEGITFTDGNRTMNVPVTHLESGDYSWTIFMALGADDEPLARPYVLNYTTETAIGPHSVSGMVTIQPFSNEGFAKREGPSPFPLLRGLLKVPGIREHLAQMEPQFSAASPKGPASEDPTNTVIFLLQGEFDFDFDDFDDNGDDPPDDIPDIRIARAGMVDSPEGDYTVNHVRDGDYLPVAIRFRSVQPGFLFFDAVGLHFDEEGEIAPITVDGSNLTDIDITAFSIEPMSAHEADAQGRAFASQMAEDAQLMFIDGFPVEPTGDAFFWDFVFYSPENDFTIHLPVPFGLDFPEVVDGKDFPEEAIPVPDVYLNSSAAMEIAEASGGADFRAEHGVYIIELEGGNLFWEFEEPELQDVHVWKVQYSALALDFESPDADFEVLQVFLNMVTGAVIEVRRPVSSEPVAELPGSIALMQNYPNPFNPTTTIPFKLAEPGHVQLEIFDVLGRHVATMVDGFHAAGTYSVSWDAAGVSSGVYVYRLKSGGSVVSRRLVVMK